jgi:hypothetical protein
VVGGEGDSAVDAGVEGDGDAVGVSVAAPVASTVVAAGVAVEDWRNDGDEYTTET